jgi:hypothetical protein
MKKTSKSNEKKPRLSNYVENLKFSTRLAVVNALRKRIDLTKLSKINKIQTMTTIIYTLRRIKLLTI